ncbi:conserved hypothetical protein [Rhodobacteraceae bacterium HTCC2083]|nr:conserved hypothetical protein [Rhodobacteraceae bacterium HTCC2083]
MKTKLFSVNITFAAFLFGVASVYADASNIVRKVDLSSTLQRACEIEQGDPYQVIAPLDGRIISHVSEGQHVTKGDLLGEYDTAELDRALRLARSRLSISQSRVDQIDGPLTESRRKLQKMGLASMQRSLHTARKEHEQLLDLAEQGRLAKRRATESAERLKQDEEDLTRAELQLVIFDIETNLQISEMRSGLLDHSIALEELEEKAASTFVTAPVDGRVNIVERRIDRTGEATVSAGTHLLSIAIPNQHWSRVEVTAQEAQEFRRATVEVFDGSDNRAAAKLLRTQRRQGALGWEKNRFEFLISFEDPDDNFLQGGSAICRFRSVVRRDAIAVSASLVWQEDGKSYVFISKDGSQIRREVRVGFIDLPFVEILSGLQEGDVVATP